MTAPWRRALVIPDIHHDIQWAQNIISKEDGNFDGIVFLGDYLDTYHRGMPNPIEIGEALSRWHEKYPSVFLIGNHDTQYVAAYRLYNRDGITDSLKAVRRIDRQFLCSGFDSIRGMLFAEHFPPEIVDALQPFVLVQGVLLSHAGFADGFRIEDEADLQKLFNKLSKDLVDLNPRSPLFYVSRSRGGMDPFGGPTWQDWTEFEDVQPWPQIVGHSGRRLPSKQTGRSYCIDNNQTTYGMLVDGQLDIRAF